jgi:pimeloyl-ACP methyl ester carboxylesterase
MNTSRQIGIRSPDGRARAAGATAFAARPSRTLPARRFVGALVIGYAATLLGCDSAPRSVADSGLDREQRPDTSARSIRLVPCHVRDVDGEARCGSLSVYENRRLRSGRRLTLNVVVLTARIARARRPDPIFLLTGGPGLGAATEAWTVDLIGPARDDHDVVLVDQRGTGGSAALDCDLYGAEPSAFLGKRFPVAAVHACLDSLERRADLTQYTTPVAADDLDDVRVALGYPAINLVGLSYGAKLALVYLRQHPTSVRRVVVDGVVTTRYPTPLPAARAGDRALRRVFADCAAERACARIYPSLEADFRHAVLRLASAPATVTLLAGHGRLRTPSKLTEEAFRNGIWSLLYWSDATREVPSAVHRAGNGDFTYGARIIAETNRHRWRRGSAGAMLSIICSEDVPFIAPAHAARAATESLVGAPLTFELIDACAGWPRASLPSGYRDPVRSDVPVLLLSGELDPVVPPDYASEAARTLSNGTHIIRPGAGHVDDDDCTIGLMAQFLAVADPTGLNASCAAHSRRRPFIDSNAIRVTAP